MLLAIVAVVVAVDVVIFLIGTAVPQTRIIAIQTSDVEHPSFINVRSYSWFTVCPLTLSRSAAYGNIPVADLGGANVPPFGGKKK